MLEGSNSDNIFFQLMAGERGSKYHLKRATIGPPSKHVFRWQADDGPSLNAALWYLCDFQGIWTSIAKKPYSFVVFQGGVVSRLPVPPSGSMHADITFNFVIVI